MSLSTERVLSRKTIATYAIGSLGTGGFATLPGLVLAIYLTDTLGIAAGFVSLIVVVPKIWDVIIDPIIGARSDRSLALTGSRRRYMMLGAILLPVFFIITFAVPAGVHGVAAAVWVLIAFTATATAFSLFQVPYIALPAELADGYDQRTRLLTARVVVLTVAILLFGAGGQELRKLGGDDEHLGYLIMAIVAGLVIGGGMLISSFVAKKGPTSVAKPSSIADGYREGFSALRRSQPFRALLLTFGLQALATGIMLTGAVYVAKWVLHDESASSLLFVALIGPALIFTPVWQFVSRKIGKERGFIIASSFYGVAAVALIGMLFAPGWWVFIPVALAGAGYAGMQSLPMAMLPDVITHDASLNGQGSAGTFGGMWTAGETTGFALGAAAFTFAIGIAGYIESTGAQVEQPTSAVSAIVIAFSAVPAVLILLSLFSFSRYRLRKVDIDS